VYRNSSFDETDVARFLSPDAVSGIGVSKAKGGSRAA
jgi:hypothetical protein